MPETAWHTEELLVLVKTYPQPSRQNRETTCVAAVNRQGEMRRVFPVPFRLLEGAAQFRKWEWVRARLLKAPKDHRPESYKIDVDTIERLERMEAGKGWAERRRWIESHLVQDFDALENRRLTSGETLGIIRPARVLGLDITPERKLEWTQEEEAKLSTEGLFDSQIVRSRTPLRKLPFAFHYRYECSIEGEIQTLRHRITDWEVGALYWNCIRSHGPRWEEPLRHKLEEDLPAKDLMFLMGTIPPLSASMAHCRPHLPAKASGGNASNDPEFRLR